MALTFGPQGPELVVDLVGPSPLRLDVADALARLALVVRRSGGSVRLLESTPALAELLELAGLGLHLGG